MRFSAYPKKIMKTNAAAFTKTSPMILASFSFYEIVTHHLLMLSNARVFVNIAGNFTKAIIFLKGCEMHAPCQCL